VNPQVAIPLSMLKLHIVFPKSAVGRSLLLASFIQALIVILLEVIIGNQIIQDIDINDLKNPNRGVPVYMFIFGGSQFWNMYLSWDAVGCFPLVSPRHAPC
jgi:hypothetical protein